MKFTVTMKDPDALCDAAQDAAKESLAKIEGLSDSERRAAQDARVSRLMEAGGYFFSFGEYLTIEIDVDDKSARVVPRSELKQ